MSSLLGRIPACGAPQAKGPGYSLQFLDLRRGPLRRSAVFPLLSLARKPIPMGLAQNRFAVLVMQCGRFSRRIRTCFFIMLNCWTWYKSRLNKCFCGAGGRQLCCRSRPPKAFSWRRTFDTLKTAVLPLQDKRIGILGNPQGGVWNKILRIHRGGHGVSRRTPKEARGSVLNE
jgi:hypothetical protein